MKEHETMNGGVTEITQEYRKEATPTAEATTKRKPTLKNFTLTTPVAILLGAVIIAFGLVGYGFASNGGNSTPLALFKGRAIDATDYIEGKTNSKVIVVEYSDPECPFCVQVSGTMKQLRADYGSKVAFAYRYFPLTQIHPHSFDESRAIACAGKIGGTQKFYEYIDALYGYKLSKQTTELASTGKEDFAKAVSLDIPSFTTCMKDNQTAQTVTNSIADGSAAGVQGTPSTFILVKTRKGYEQVSMVDGARPIDYFKTAIEEALAR